MYFPAVQYPQYPSFRADNPWAQGYGIYSQYRHYQSHSGNRLTMTNRETEPASVRERAAEFARRERDVNRAVEENLLGHLSTRSAISDTPSVHCTLDRHTSSNAVTTMNNCSGDHAHSQNLATKPDIRDIALMPPLKQVTDNASEFTSASDNSLPLNLSIPGKVSVSAPHSPAVSDSSEPQRQRLRKPHTKLPRWSPIDETCKHRLIVRQKIYDIEPIGCGLWILSGNCDF